MFLVMLPLYWLIGKGILYNKIHTRDYITKEEEKCSKQESDLLAKVPEHDKEVGQRQDTNDYELIQYEYLRNLGMTDLMDENYDTCQIRDHRQMQKEIKTDKMSTLRKEIEFLERAMQRVRTKLKRLQQDPTPSTSMTGLRPKQP